MTQSEATAKDQYTALAVKIDELLEQLSRLVERHASIAQRIGGPDGGDVVEMSRVRESLRQAIGHIGYTQLHHDDDNSDQLEPEF